MSQNAVVLFPYGLLAADDLRERLFHCGADLARLLDASGLHLGRLMRMCGGETNFIIVLPATKDVEKDVLGFREREVDRYPILANALWVIFLGRNTQDDFPSHAIRLGDIAGDQPGASVWRSRSGFSFLVLTADRCDVAYLKKMVEQAKDPRFGRRSAATRPSGPYLAVSPRRTGGGPTTK